MWCLGCKGRYLTLLLGVKINRTFSQEQFLESTFFINSVSKRVLQIISAIFYNLTSSNLNHKFAFGLYQQKKLLKIRSKLVITVIIVLKGERPPRHNALVDDVAAVN